MLKAYRPEMGQAKPACRAEAQLSHYGEHYFVSVAPEVVVKPGRGVKFLGTKTAEHLVPQAQHKVGWREYKMTEKAFEVFKATIDVAYEMLLD